jgi:hypothetical protein
VREAKVDVSVPEKPVGTFEEMLEILDEYIMKNNYILATGTDVGSMKRNY